MVASVNYKQIKFPSTKIDDTKVDDTKIDDKSDANSLSVNDSNGQKTTDTINKASNISNNLTNKLTNNLTDKLTSNSYVAKDVPNTGSINDSTSTKDNIRENTNKTHTNKLNTSWLEKQIKSCNDTSTYLFYRVEEHELKSKELFDKIAKQELKKRLLERFYNKYKEIKNIQNESERSNALQKLNTEFLNTQVLSKELDKYTNSSATKEFLLEILTLEDYNQLKLALIAITGCDNEATKILSSNIGLFEDYIEDRAKFAKTISKIQSEYKNKKSLRNVINEALNKAV